MNISANEDGSWETSFRIPPSTQGSHKIDARGDTSSLAAVNDATFEVTPGISINKSSGSVGESITMTGSGFAADERDIEILFDGQAVVTDIRADDTGYWEENFEVPEMPKGTYSVTAEGESTPKEAISALSFTIRPGLVLSPDEGHVGTDLTVTGGGFAANKDVVIKYDGSQVETATTNDKGSFRQFFRAREPTWRASSDSRGYCREQCHRYLHHGIRPPGHTGTHFTARRKPGGVHRQGEADICVVGGIR